MDVLSLDLGGSSGKVFRGRFSGQKINLIETHRFDNYAVQLNGGLYWDFLNIWKNLCIGIQKADGERAFSSLGIDAFCNDFGFIDKRGRLLGHVRSYRDSRTIRCAKAIYATTSPEYIYKETGNQIAPFSTLMQLSAMRLEEDDLLMDHADCLLFVPDLLAFYITGERLAESTLCSVTQMYRADRSGWSSSIFHAHNIPSDLFAPVITPGKVSGRATNKFCNTWNVRAFDYVSVCEHDTASAFLALPGNDDRVIISSGTWAIVGCETKEPVISDYGFRYNFANEGSLPDRNRLLRNVMGTWLLQELRTEFAAKGEVYNYAQLVDLATQCDSFCFLIDVDQDVFYSPGNMSRKIQEQCWAIKGDKPITIGQLARCIFESLALKYRYCIDRLENLSGRTFPMINIIGGGARDTLTCQMTANACSKPVLAGPAEATALGNILVQLIAHKKISSIEQGRQLVSDSFTFVEYDPVECSKWNDIYHAFLMRYKLD